MHGPAKTGSVKPTLREVAFTLTQAPVTVIHTSETETHTSGAFVVTRTSKHS